MKKEYFFTMYQDALFKSLLPAWNLNKVMENENNESNIISLINAKFPGFLILLLLFYKFSSPSSVFSN